MADDAVQDDQVVKDLLADQQRMESERAPWEPIWKDIERRVDPQAEGGFEAKSPSVRGLDNFDPTAIRGLGRFTAVIAALSVPRKQWWHGLNFGLPELDRLEVVKRWCEEGARRLFAMRYAPRTGFTRQSYADIRQMGSYGTNAFWTHEQPGIGLRYRALHLSEIFIDEDFAGLVDVVHRKFELNARQAAQQFGIEALPPKVAQALKDNKPDQRFQFLHVVRPNRDREPDRFDWRAMPIESITIAIDEKWVVRRKGYWSMPITVARHAASPREKYGRSPAMNVIGTIKTVNEMAKTILRAGHKAVDPAMAFYDDGDISKLATKPGGLNPGLVDNAGRLLVQPIPTGGNLPLGMELLENERSLIKTEFLEEFFRLLSEPSDRMTATQVLETLQKEGVLIAPFADGYESEKLAPGVERELEVAMRAGQLPPLPPEVIEAGAKARPMMTNPLTRMAQAESVAGFARWTEMLTGVAAFDEEIMDLMDTEAAARGSADVLGVPPSWVRTPDQVAERRAARAKAKEETAFLEGAPKAAAAALDLTRAGQISGEIAA